MIEFIKATVKNNLRVIFKPHTQENFEIIVTSPTGLSKGLIVSKEVLDFMAPGVIDVFLLDNFKELM